MEELIPLGSGLLLGALLGALTPAWRLPAGAALAVALGVFATVATGESAISWSYLLVDIPLVAVSAVLGLLAGRRNRRAGRGTGSRMKRPGEEDHPPDGHAEDRRREFEESRGITRHRELDLDDEEPTGDEEPPPHDEEAES